jgi:hypothetical protein
MSKRFLLSLAVAFSLIVANASAAEVETIVLVGPASCGFTSGSKASRGHKDDLDAGSQRV